MPSSWNLKLTYELSEHEMLDYVRHLEKIDAFGNEEDIERLIEHCVSEWSRMRREQNDGMGYLYTTRPVTIMRGPTSAGYISELASNPPIEWTAERTVTVKIYPWMDEKHVRFLARMQLQEQLAV